MGSIGCEGEPYVEPFIPFLLSRIRVDDFSASFAHLRRTYLQPSPHVLATVPARTCNRPCTYLQPSLHVLASADSVTCTLGKRRLHLGLLSQEISTEPMFLLCAVHMKKQEGNTFDKCLPPVPFSFNRDIRLPIRVRLHPEQQHWHSSSCLPGTWPCP